MKVTSLNVWDGDEMQYDVHPEDQREFRFGVLVLLERIARALEDANRLEGNHPSRI